MLFFKDDELECEELDGWYDCNKPEGHHDEEPSDEHENDQHLYGGARKSLGKSMLLILLFASRRSLTGVVLVDLLNLIALHCLKPNFW